LISDYKDVLEIIGENELSNKTLVNKVNTDLNNKPAEKIFSDNNILLDKDEKLVYSMISCDQVSFDFIAASIDLSVNKINSCLTMLEMNGLIKKLPGQFYVRS
jgi:DNA processing protein